VAEPSNAPAGAAALTSREIGAAIGIAIAVSLVFALIEIPSKAKTTKLRACLVGPSFFYWGVLSFGNTVTTLLASVAVVKMLPTLSDYYSLLSAFFGVFGFETVLKNTNITMFDRGVLTIQNWIDKALDAAAASAIDRQETLKQEEETKLVFKLQQRTETDINTRVLSKMGAGKVEMLDAAARGSAADPKLYKILQLVTTLSSNERAALLKGSGAPSSVATPSHGTAPSPAAWQIGHRVLALWSADGYWYTGTIIDSSHNGFLAHYDDGIEKWLTTENIKALGYRVGDPVECRWKRLKFYYLARIVEINGDQITVQYDNDSSPNGPSLGEKEQTNITLVRFSI